MPILSPNSAPSAMKPLYQAGIKMQFSRLQRDVSSDRLLFKGNRQVSVSRDLIQAAFLKSSDKCLYLVLRSLLTLHPTRNLMPSYEELMRLTQLSRGTIANCLHVLRISRWITVSKPSRDQKTGRFQGNVYTLYDEPVSLETVMQLDNQYLDTLEHLAQHAQQRVKNLAQRLLEEYRSQRHPATTAPPIEKIFDNTANNDSQLQPPVSVLTSQRPVQDQSTKTQTQNLGQDGEVIIETLNSLSEKATQFQEHASGQNMVVILPSQEAEQNQNVKIQPHAIVNTAPAINQALTPIMDYPVHVLDAAINVLAKTMPSALQYPRPTPQQAEQPIDLSGEQSYDIPIGTTATYPVDNHHIDPTLIWPPQILADEQRVIWRSLSLCPEKDRQDLLDELAAKLQPACKNKVMNPAAWIAWASKQLRDGGIYPMTSAGLQYRCQREKEQQRQDSDAIKKQELVQKQQALKEKQHDTPVKTRSTDHRQHIAALRQSLWGGPT